MTNRLLWFIELVVATFLGYMVWSWLDSIHVYSQIVVYLEYYGVVFSVLGYEYWAPYWGISLFFLFVYVVYKLIQGLRGDWGKDEREAREAKEQKLAGLIDEAVRIAVSKEMMRYDLRKREGTEAKKKESKP